MNADKLFTDGNKGKGKRMRNNLKPNVYSQKRAVFFATDRMFGEWRDTASAWRLWFSGIKQRPLGVLRLLPCPPASNMGGNGRVSGEQRQVQGE